MNANTRVTPHQVVYSSQLQADYAKLGSVRELDVSHAAQARRLGEVYFDDNARYVHAWRSWFFWDGRHWCLDTVQKARAEIRAFVQAEADCLRHLAKQAMNSGHPSDYQWFKWARQQAQHLKSAANISAVESLLQTNTDLVASPEDFDADIFLLGTPSGSVDLKTGDVQPAKRSDLITKLTACGPASEDTSPTLWLKFLDRIFAGDQDIIGFMQRIAGYALTGSTEEHKLFFLYGGGRNGKSVFLDTLKSVLGGYAKGASSSLLLGSKHGDHPTGLADLRGARLVVASEIPRNATWNESLIKDLTGGEEISARKMRQDFSSFRPELTLMIAGNDRPALNGVDAAIKARLVLIPFNVQIPAEERDPQLARKLQAEWPAILRWAIDGAILWRKQGLMIPHSIRDASHVYLDEQDDLQNFLSEETYIDPDQHVFTADLYERYKLWCHEHGMRFEIRKRFKADLEAKGLWEQRGIRPRRILGIGLRDRKAT